jgi:hypothetical protein
MLACVCVEGVHVCVSVRVCANAYVHQRACAQMCVRVCVHTLAILTNHSTCIDDKTKKQRYPQQYQEDNYNFDKSPVNFHILALP